MMKARNVSRPRHELHAGERDRMPGRRPDIRMFVIRPHPHP